MIAGDKFSYRMEAKDGCMGIDFEGKYTNTLTHELIEASLSGRIMQIEFIEQSSMTTVREIFEADVGAPIEMQKAGCQVSAKRGFQLCSRVHFPKP